MAVINHRDRLPRLRLDATPDNIIEDANRALATIPTATTTEINGLMYATATLILVMVVKLKRLT